MYSYRSLEFSNEFLSDFGGLNPSERRLIVKALEYLDSDERYPSLAVHQLHGEHAGTWAAYASRRIRVVYERLESGRKGLLGCSRHYER